MAATSTRPVEASTHHLCVALHRAPLPVAATAPEELVNCMTTPAGKSVADGRAIVDYQHAYQFVATQ